jgi:glc operon protein GlcG
MAQKAEQFAGKKGWNVAIAIVNSEGNLVYFQRNPEAYSGSIEASIQKAKSSNAFQRPTRAFVEGIQQGRIGLVTVKDIVAIEGGIPIVVGGRHVGAIGVSGAKATEDEEVAKAALE